MDVTCERCKTGYEFDDALVSERGTSVRCTTCGHTFKVKRPAAGGPAPAAGKERWLVRTIDGRELEFRALRELQAAIGKGLVRRDDVLARENGRPRRLGSIAELDPFFSSRTLTAAQQGAFSKTSIGVWPPRQRSHTPPGLGDAPEASPRPAAPDATRSPLPSTTEGSVAIPLAAAMARGVADAGKKAEGKARNPLPSFSSTEGTVAGVPRADVVGFEGSGPPEGEEVTHQVSRAELEQQIREAESMATADSVAASLPKPSVPPPAADAPEPLPPPQSREVVTQRMAARAKVRNQAPIAFDEASSAGAAPARAEPAPTSGDGPVSSSASSHLPELLPPAPDPAVPARPPTPAKAQAATAPAATTPAGDAPEGVPTPTPTSDGEPKPGRSSLADIRPSAMSLVNLTPTPADVRYSYVQEHTRSSGDGRFSGAESRRVGSARWIFALLLLGAVVVGGGIVARRYFSKDATTTAAGDERVAQLLAAAEKALGVGDLETAKEEVDRASGLAEKDPRVAELALRIANERAELPWLELRFLAAEDGARPAIKQRLAERVGRAKTAAARAAELAPSDPKVLRERIDALRLAGELPAARALVPQVAAASSESRTQVVLSALDLAEDAPPFATLVPRLAKAAAEEGDGGRARLLLVYALARSGDVTRASAELAKLRPTHPLRAPAQSFLERTGKGVPPSLDIESLPDAAPTASGETPSTDEVPVDFRKALEQAGQALAKGDQAKAEKLYRATLDRDPGNVEALAGIGHVARARGQTGAAIESYRRSVEAAPGYLPALLPLADLLWDGGDRGAATEYYRRIIQLAPGSGAADRARERIGEGGSAPAPTGGSGPPPEASSGPPGPPDGAPAPTDGPAPAPSAPPTPPPTEPPDPPPGEAPPTPAPEGAP